MTQTTQVNIPQEIIGDRINLRVPDATFENAQIVFDTVVRNKEEFRKWLPFPDKTNHPEDSFQFLTGVQKAFNSSERGEYFIYEKSTGDFCGIISIVHKTSVHDDYWTIGYWQDKEKCGKGYISEAVTLLERMLFEQGINRIEIRNDVRNVASAGVAKRLGYHLDGIIREAGYTPYFKDYRNTNIWSKIKSDLK